MSRARSVAVLVLALGVAACGESERSRRYEIERARWQTMRTERGWRESREGSPQEIDERVAELHRNIERSWGAAAPPDGRALREPDTALRLRLAASSALTAADIVARREITPELAEEYDRIGRVYGFDASLRARARIAEGRTWEGLGSRGRALSVYREYLARDGRPGRTGGPLSRVERFDVDLEIHAAMLAERELPAKEVRDLRREIRDRLARTSEVWDGRSGVLRVARRQAEIEALLGDPEAAVEGLETLLGDAIPGDERAELLLTIGGLLEDRLRRTGEAERHYRDAAREGDEVEAAAEARLRLGELLVRRGQVRDGLEVLDLLLQLGARVREDRQSEILYWKGRALVALDRWEDALPVFRSAADADAESPFALAAAARYRARLARLSRSAGRGDQLVVETAERVPPPEERVVVPRDWATEVRRQRRDRVWAEGLESLRRVASGTPDQDLGARAEAERSRLRAERGASSDWENRSNEG